MTLTAIQANPEEILSAASFPVVIDEAQLIEDLPLHVKRIVDQTRQPGQFLLTGSSSIGKGGASSVNIQDTKGIDAFRRAILLTS